MGCTPIRMHPKLCAPCDQGLSVQCPGTERLLAGIAKPLSSGFLPPPIWLPHPTGGCSPRTCAAVQASFFVALAGDGTATAGLCVRSTNGFAGASIWMASTALASTAAGGGVPWQFEAASATTGTEALRGSAELGPLAQSTRMPSGSLITACMVDRSIALLMEFSRSGAHAESKRVA